MTILKKTRIFISGIFLVVICSADFFVQAYSFGLPQSMDPFYSRMLEKGKESFLKGRFQDAVTEIEVGMFGLGEEPILLGEGHIYLALSHHYLDHISLAKEHLSKAVDLLEIEGVMLLGLPAPHKKKLESLMVEFQFRVPVAADDRGAPVYDPDMPGDPDSIPEWKQTVQDLERRLKAHPEEVTTYLRLYSLYIQAQKPGEAEKVLKKLIKEHPGSAQGLYLLGRLNYNKGKYKAAENYLSQVFELSPQGNVSQETLLLSRAFQLLSADLRGDGERAAQMAIGSLDIFTVDQINVLPLSPEEKELLTAIMEEARNQKEAAIADAEVAALEKKIQSHPGDLSNYYDLYEIYRIKNDFTKAKHVIRLMTKNIPSHLYGHFILAKMEYMDNHYGRALSCCSFILDEGEKQEFTSDLRMRVTAYAALCLDCMGREEEAAVHVGYLTDNLEEVELRSLLEEENILADWQEHFDQ